GCTRTKPLDEATHFRFDRLGIVRVLDTAETPDHVEDEEIRNPGAMRGAPPTKNACGAADHALDEFMNQARLADARLSDDRDDPAAAIDRLLEQTLQHRHFAVAAHELRAGPSGLGRSAPDQPRRYHVVLQMTRDLEVALERHRGAIGQRDLGTAH